MTRPRDAADPWRDSVVNDCAALGDDAMSMDAHPDEDVWVRFACDELGADERMRLVDHALACAACAGTLRAVTHVRQGAAAIDDAGPRASLTTRSHRPYIWLGVAAVLVLAIGAAIVLRSGDLTRRPGAPIASVTPAEQRPQVTRAEPATWARLDTPPELRLPASLALAVRGTDQDRDALLEAFGQANAHYRAGRFGEAADLLAPLAARRPDIPEFTFSLGIARLFSGDSAAAVAPLRQARASTALAHETQWYEAVALERLERRQEAKQLLGALCAASNPYQARACEALRAGS